MLIGTLVLSSIFKFDIMITLLGVYFGIEAFIYFLLVIFFSIMDKKSFYTKSGELFKGYTFLFEPIFVAVAFYLEHYFMGICMTISLFGFLFLFAGYKEYLSNKEGSDEDKEFKRFEERSGVTTDVGKED
jgi:hypothetical protein